MAPWLRYDRDWQRSGLEEEATFSETTPVVRRFRVPLGAGDKAAGQRLLFFSDLHWCRRDEEGGERLVELINNTKADWIVFGGDLIRHLEHLEAATALLGRLQAGRGKVAVLGNRERHHFWLDLRSWYDRYERCGFRLLVNEPWPTSREGDPVLVGLDDCRHGEPGLDCVAEFADSGRFTVVVTHSPDMVGHSTGSFVGNLVLAGHTHGGQLRIPRLGSVYTASAYWRQFDLGWYRRRSDGARMYVTSGLGETGRGILRCRLCCPREIVLLDLARQM